jgi:hypothetical protein
MHIALKIALYSYAITTVINIIILPVKEHKHLLKEHGKRKAYADFITGSLVCFIPYIVFIMLMIFELGDLNKNLKKWIEKDPTNPKNIADPDFDPPPKKEKKVKPVEPINNRTEILDL